MKKLAVGIDIGGTNTVYGLVDRDGVMYGEGTISTQAYPDFDVYIEVIKCGIDALLSECKEPVQIVGVGVGAPNSNHFEGTIDNGPNVPWSGVVPFVDKMKVLFANVPIILTNDANAAAVGEMIYGGAKGMSDFIVVTLGTGVGSGFVASSKLIYGHDGLAGELGHVTAIRDGRACGCGKRGCLETYTSATGLKRTIYQFLESENIPSVLRGRCVDELTSKDVYDAAVGGDKIAQMIFEYTGKILGWALADAVAITSPKAIFLFGGLAKAGDLIFEPTRKYMNENLLYMYKDKVQLLPSGVNGKNAALLGASALVWNEL